MPDSLFICLMAVVAMCFFMIGYLVWEFITDCKKAKRNRIIREKGYLPIEMEKKR
jgi:hypothetical protein